MANAGEQEMNGGNGAAAAFLADAMYMAELRQRMLSFASLQLADPGLAEDAVQEALAALHGPGAERIGGLPSLTAVLVISTGIIGAVFARYLYRWLRIDDDAVRGFAIGIASHGIGTARAFQVSEEMGAFAGLAMGLTALLTAFIAPWLAPWLVDLAQ